MSEKEREICEFEKNLDNFFCLRSNLSYQPRPQGLSLLGLFRFKGKDLRTRLLGYDKFCRPGLKTGRPRVVPICPLG